MHQGYVTRALRCLAVALFVTYLSWNIWWLAHGQVPPALLRALTGLPAPTTGGTRSVQAMVNGEWGQALLWNPMTLPVLALFGVSVGWLTLCALRGRRLRLPERLWHGWAAVLAVAWLLKLSLGPRWW